MRIDHHAYQRGTQVAGFGFLLQFVIGLTLLIFSWVTADTTLFFASGYVLLGTLVWLSLVVVFHQHKLERLEALEEDELAAARAGTSSIFDAAADEARVAARRLALMYKWLLPTVSLVLAGALLLLAYFVGSHMNRIGDAVEEGGRDFMMSTQLGWAVALCLSIALVTFIFSRFVAGMAKLPAWQNLRGGAGYMVGNSLIMLAVATGTVFRVFENEALLAFVAQWVIPGGLIIIAAEIILLFILNVYRPRVPGETPRAAFDSRLLSLLAAPDSIVRSLNEAVNYQFGFDITSSWGYQLLLRSFVWLIGLGALVLVLLNTMVIVEPHQQAVKLSWGKLVGEAHGSGIMWKLPWPFQTAEVYDVTTLREINLTARQLPRFRDRDIHAWTTELEAEMDREPEPFIVGSTSLLLDFELDDDDLFFEVANGDREVFEDAPVPAPGDAEGEIEIYVPVDPELTEERQVEAAVSQVYALLDAEMSLQYRIRSEPGNSGLLDYLRFAPDVVTRRQRMTDREEVLRLLALREITQHFSAMSLDDVLTGNRNRLASDLRVRVQRAFDEKQAGVEIVSINMPLLRPAGQTAQRYEELAVGNQARQQYIAIARRNLNMALSYVAGDVPTAMRLIDEIDAFNEMRDELGSSHPDVMERAAEIERDLVRTGGSVAQMITSAERDRWVQLMEARSQASRTRGQQWAFRASPRLYSQREIMRVVANTIGPVRKYMIGIDAERVNLDVELKELSPLLDFSQTIGEGE